MKIWLRGFGYMIILSIFLFGGVTSAITPQEVSCAKQGSAGGTCFYDPSEECGADTSAETDTTTSPDITIEGPFLPKAKPSDKVKVNDAYKGKASTYGNDPATGYVDPGDVDGSGKPLKPALVGAKNSQPAIAVYNNGSLGGWWKVIAPNGKSAILQQTDLGPSTSRITDINSGAAKNVFNYKQGDKFPTDQGDWKIEYMGKTKPDGAITAPSGEPSSPASSSSSAALESAPSSCCPSDGSSTTATSDSNFVPDDQLPGKDNREKSWNYLKSLGFTDNEAAGAVGSIAVEGVFDPQSVEDGYGLVPRSKNPDDAGDKGWGLLGFTPGHSVFDFWAKKAGLSKEVGYNNIYYISTQLSIAYNYMKHVDGDGGGNMWKEYQASAAKSPSEAALAWEAQVENAGVKASAERDAAAKAAIDDFGNGGSSSVATTSTAACCPSVGSSGATGDTTLTGKTPAEQAYNYFVAQGLPPKGAAGVVGNMMAESGGNAENLDTHAHNDLYGTHDGIVQWSTSRWADLKRHEHGDPYDLAKQLDFAWYEMTKVSTYTPVLPKLKNAKTPQDAAAAFNEIVEVSGEDPTTRGANALTIFKKYGSNAAGASAQGTCSADNLGPVNIIKHDAFGNADGLMGHKPTMIGLHYTAGNEQTVGEIVTALSDPTGAKGCNKSCSVQLTVDPKGHVYQLTSRLDVVTENIINFNNADIGIEIMGPDEKALLNNKAQFKAVTALVAQLMQQYNINMEQDYKNKSGLMGHFECDQWSQNHIGQDFAGKYKGDTVQSTDSHTDPGKQYMSKVRGVVGDALEN